MLVLLVLVPITAACDGSGLPTVTSAATTPSPASAGWSSSSTGSIPGVLARGHQPDSTAGTGYDTPIASPVVIDLPGRSDAFGILARVVDGMLHRSSFRFEKRVHLSISDDVDIGSGFDVDVVWATGVVTDRGAEVHADETPLLEGIFAGDPASLAVIAEAQGRLNYEARQIVRRTYLTAPVVDTLSQLFDDGPEYASGSEKADRAEVRLRPLVDGWIRLDWSGLVFLSEAMSIGGDVLPTDPRDLLLGLTGAYEVGKPKREELGGTGLTRVDLVIPLPYLYYFNGDLDFSALSENLEAQGASPEESDSLRRALMGSDALVTVWTDDEDHIVRVEYELGAEAVAPAIRSPSLAAALDRLDLVEHVILTFSDFDDPALTVEPPVDFAPVAAADYF